MLQDSLQKKYVDFPGGDFDSDGVHWLLRDGLGSVGMTVDNTGKVEQHVQYYPYGEPHREPQGQPYLYGGKERRRFGGLNDYDFHARFLNPSAALWHAPDPHASRYPWLSPYAFCASNPVRYSDPTGMDIFIFNSKGFLVFREKADFDRIEVSGSMRYVEGEDMPLGTINMKSAVNKKGEKYEYMEMKGDSNGRSVFKTLAAGTDVEFGLVQAGSKGDEGDNYISTSHIEDENVSSNNIINDVIGHEGGLRTHTHNHPSGLLSPSEGDKNFAKNIEKYYQKGSVVLTIYTTESNPITGNEIQYDSNSKIINRDDFIFMRNLISKYLNKQMK